MPKAKRPPPLSVRLTPQERAALERLAGGMGLSTYLKQCALGGELNPTRTSGKAPLKDQKALAALVALFGRSQLAQNVAELTKAARTGSLPVNEHTLKDIETACKDVAEMRALLLQSLGVQA